MTEEGGSPLHAGIAEHGKVCALKGNHVEALLHYREAMNLAVRNRAPEVVFRHYLECSLESLEHMGAYQDLLEYCERALAHYAERPPEQALAWFDLASIHQRRGVALLKLGDRAGASAAFAAAVETACTCGAALPLADQLARWLKAELTLGKDRIVAEQLRHRYFSVRKETVHPSRAVPMHGSLRTGAAAFAGR